MVDPAETSLSEDYAFRGREEERRDFLRVRHDQLENNQNMLLGRMSLTMATLSRARLRRQSLSLSAWGTRSIETGSPGRPSAIPTSSPIPRVRFACAVSECERPRCSR